MKIYIQIFVDIQRRMDLIKLTRESSKRKISLRNFLLVFMSSLFFFLCGQNQAQQLTKYDLVIVGASTGGTGAALHAHSAGIKTLVIEEGKWLGGMLTSAGVSAVDGNHNLQGGVYKKFRDELVKYYGGNDKLATGWVSHTLFEPQVGAKILSDFLRNSPSVSVSFSSELTNVYFDGSTYTISYSDEKGKSHSIVSDFLIDATPLGDIAASLGVSYDIGMEASSSTGEAQGPEFSNDLIQDLTYVAIVERKIGAKPVAKPKNYNPEDFSCLCDPTKILPSGISDCEQMLNYGKLPNNKYMLNWPNCGNDFFVNIIDLSKEERTKALNQAKDYTQGFIYYLQQELGFKDLQIAKDVFPTKDGYPMEAYHREGRRIQGKVRLNAYHLQSPYEYDLYRTGIAVGDYPIDHHHKKKSDVPVIEFIEIKIPAYNVPLGALIPANGPKNLLVAEKSISVSNIVNGSTRLQPVIFGIGQAAGATVEVAKKSGKDIKDINIREVQASLLDDGALIMPFMDTPATDPNFKIYQKIGATGILKGFGLSYLWANQMWFYPNREISEYEYMQGLEGFLDLKIDLPASGAPLTISFFIKSLEKIKGMGLDQYFDGFKIPTIESDKKLTRGELAIYLDKYLNPFDVALNMDGTLSNPFSK